MSDLYRHEPHKFADGGLQLRVPVDLVPPGQYARLTNAIPTIEGSLRTRAGIAFSTQPASAATYGPQLGVHSLFRLNQTNISAVSQRIIGSFDQVWVGGLNGAVYTDATPFFGGLQGNPLTLIDYHYPADPASWALLAERGAIFQYRPNVNLGYSRRIAQPPWNPATATAGAAGNLNSTGGPDYDWVYTFYDPITGTETNPSPVRYAAASLETLSPTVVTSPEAGFGGAAFGTVGIATGLSTGTTLSASETRQSAMWSGWPAPTKAPYSLLYLQVLWSAVHITTPSTGTPYAAIYFSLDGGTSWRLIVDTTIGDTGRSDVPYLGGTAAWIDLPANVDLTKLQVRGVVLSVGDTSTPQPIIGRRIRERGGNFNLTGILTGGGGNVQYQLGITGPTVIGVIQSPVVNGLALANQQGVVCVQTPPAGFNVRLYRRGGSVTAGHAFVGEFVGATLSAGGCGGSTVQITDNVADSALGSFVEVTDANGTPLTNDPPVTSVYMHNRPLPYIWGPAGLSNRVLGCGDPDRPDAVYFSNAGNASQWSAQNWVSISSASDSMQNGCVYNTRVFAFSHERMFELVEGLIGGVTYTPFPTPCARGLISPWGLCVADAIYFVSKDGIYRTDGGPQQSLTEDSIQPLWPTLDSPARSVEGYDTVDLERIEDISLAYINNEIYFTYRGATGGALQTLIYDVVKNRWRAMNEGEANFLRAFYSEPTTQAGFLMGDTTGNVYTGAASAADSNHNSTATLAIPVTIRTGAFDQGQPLNQKEYGNVIIDIDPGGATVANPVTITPLLNGETITSSAINVTGTGRQQVPLDLGDVFGYNIELQITWSRTDLNTPGVAAVINPILYQFDILFRFEPVSVTHWEARETSHGLPGWMHIRDAYIAIRSSSTVTMSVVVDGVTTTYSLASTSGARRKVYVPFASNKGKLYQYKFDSADGTTPFRLYVEDIELRVKPWLTSLGYKLMKPFGGESVLAQPALESSIETGGIG